MSILHRTKAAPLTPAVDSTIVPIADVPPRTRVRIRGSVTRIRARPTDGQPTLDITITDDTGTINAVWTGRRSIGGISLGRTLVIEGMPVQHRDHLEFMNPAYTLCADGPPSRR